MKIPSKVRITSKVCYEVVFVDHFIDDDPKSKYLTRGECRKEQKQIVIKNGMSKTETYKTLLHEILHAVEFESKHPIPHKTVYMLEKNLWRLLKLNKWID